MTVSLTKFGHATNYRIPPEGAGDRVSHSRFYYVKVIGLSGVFKPPARFSCASSGVGGTISAYYAFEDGHRFTLVLDDSSEGDFVADETVNITSLEGMFTAQLKSWERVIMGVNAISDPHNPSNHLAIDASGSAYMRFADGQPILGGFGSLKINEQQVLGVYESSQASYDDLFSVATANGGTNTYDTGASSTVLMTSTANGSTVTRTTNRYHYYLPGSANFIIQTIACGDVGKANNSRRWGAYDDNDGVFFELQGTTLNAVLRSSTSGTVVETRIPQNTWNQDRLDGTGTTKADIDVTKVNIYWIDYQWLGAGRIRFGIVEPTGARLTCHIIENAGTHTRPYMRTGTLPLRTENVNTGVTASSSELREVCMAIYTEGRRQDYTFWRVDLGSTTATVSAPDTHIMSLRSKGNIDGVRNSVVAYPEIISVYTTQPVSLTFWQNSDVANASWNIDSGSAIEATFDGDVTTPSALRFKTLFFEPGAHNFEMTKFFETNDEGIALTGANTPEIWSITATPLTASSANVTVNCDVRELW